MEKQLNRPFSYGTSLGEYGLVLGLVVVASITAIVMMGGNLSSMMSGTSMQIAHPNSSAAAIERLLAVAEFAIRPGGDPMNPDDYIVRPPSTNEDVVCNYGGICFNVPTDEVVATDEPIDLTAGRGNDEIVPPRLGQSAALLEQLAEQMDAAGDPVLAQLIRDHADNTHDVGREILSNYDYFAILTEDNDVTSTDIVDGTNGGGWYNNSFYDIQNHIFGKYPELTASDYYSDLMFQKDTVNTPELSALTIIRDETYKVEKVYENFHVESLKTMLDDSGAGVNIGYGFEISPTAYRAIEKNRKESANTSRMSGNTICSQQWSPSCQVLSYQ